jgi:hypothetical protein
MPCNKRDQFGDLARICEFKALQHPGKSMRLKRLFTAALVLTLSSQASAAESPPQPIAFERQAIEFSPTRPDLTVGIAWFTVLTPGKDWTVNVKNLDKEDFDDRGDQKYLELKQVGKNRFELPALTIEPASEKSGAVCMSVKIWFNEIPNERLFFFVKLEDRYAQLSYCTRDVPEAEHHFSQNRVATLEEFRERLKKPIVLNLTNDRVAWRPGIIADDRGTLYFHSLIVGRTAFTWGGTHTSGIWKLSSDGKLEQLETPNLTTRQRWLNLIRKLPDDRYGTVIQAAFKQPVACDRKGNLYFEELKQDNVDAPQFRRIVKIDANGEERTVAGSKRGVRDGSAEEAQFSNITALAVGPSGDVYVADGAPDSGSWIRRIAPGGTVTTLAGSDKPGFADGKRDAARFYCPSQLAVDSSGNIYAADAVNSRVRKITPDGTVTTVVGGGSNDSRDDEFVQPTGVAAGPNGELYVLDGGPKMARVRKVALDGKVTTLVVVDAKTKMAKQRQSLPPAGSAAP